MQHATSVMCEGAGVLEHLRASCNCAEGGALLAHSQGPLSRAPSDVLLKDTVHRARWTRVTSSHGGAVAHNRACLTHLLSPTSC